MDINQENNTRNGIVVVRKSSIVKNIFFILIGLILGSAIVGLLFLSYNNKEEKDASVKPKVDKGKRVGDNTPDASNPKNILMSIEVSKFSGVVTAIENSSILVKTSFFGEEKNFNVLIDGNTTISKRKTGTASQTGGDPNQNISESSAKFSDIKKGDGVFVDASENIKEKKEFLAKGIIIFEYPPLPTAPPL